MGELLIDWTARLAVMCYLIRMLADLSVIGIPRWFVRDVWILGSAIFLVHVLAAFQFEHNWSHEAAFQHTAEQTEAAVGWKSGFGLYLNYVTLIWWLLDAALIRVRFPFSDQTRQRYRMVFHIWFGFMVFNATIVFGPWGWRIVSILLLPLIASRYTRGRSKPD